MDCSCTPGAPSGAWPLLGLGALGPRWPWLGPAKTQMWTSSVTQHLFCPQPHLPGGVMSQGRGEALMTLAGVQTQGGVGCAPGRWSDMLRGAISKLSPTTAAPLTFHGI